MKLEIVTKEEFQDLKEMMQEILCLLKKEKSDDEWLNAKGIKEMLKCSDSTLANYRTAGILQGVKHGGRYLYSKRAVNGLLNGIMNSQAN